MNDHLGKPATPEQLEQVLTRWVRGQRNASPREARPVPNASEGA
jgi:hypothetical protein